jgi:hypothetical protein
MIKLIIVLAVIYILVLTLRIFVSDYDKCYSEMEDAGIAAFDCCRGLTGGNRCTGYLQESCVECPYLVLPDKK